ncbi:carbamate kinase [Amycolatopsis benzoatilytica]|uniref:carbamate kinase n=1 Tax=Amycolatopsis benzoatilytica TaxID=346045 RepID=UPI000369D03E|nr:carbamate kinase [Amycolatopsis benzoatilytica]
MRIVVALGGNALLERGEPADSEIQEAHVLAAAAALAPVAREHELVLTHGNGPQVGLLALESERDPALSRPYPFDVLGAQTQGMIGYWLVQALQNATGRPAVALLTRTLVRADDPALSRPTKFVGPVYDRAAADRLAAERGWQVRPDGSGWRRVVASPEPVGLVELPSVRTLMEAGAIVVCAGGGGVPVAAGPDGLHGIEAVVDKDRTAALVARSIDADALLLLTDVDAVQDGFGTPQARAIREASCTQLRSRSFPAGSMGPKVDAACRFVEGGGKFAAIGRLTAATELAAGTAGTVVRG